MKNKIIAQKTKKSYKAVAGVLLVIAAFINSYTFTDGVPRPIEENAAASFILFVAGIYLISRDYPKR